MPSNSAADNRTRTVVLPGRDITNTPAAQPTPNKFLEVEPLAVAAVDTKVRAGADAKTQPKEAEPGDVVEITFKNGTRQWYAVRQLPEVLTELATAPERAATDGAPGQAAGTVEIPALWERTTATRGWRENLAGLSANIVSLLRPNLEKSLLDLITAQGPELAAKLIAEHFEAKFEEAIKSGTGLYRFSLPEALAQEPLTAKALNNSLPYLLFLHGTASSTVGSFSSLGVRHGGDLFKLVTTPEWEKLQQVYGDRVIAYEHRTLSRSPLANALELAQTLPDGARLHLVTHSRGGLVGELLCLGQVQEQARGGGRKAFKERLQLPFEKENRQEDIETLHQLIDVIGGKRLQVERFVRVACPARGTKLASQRINDLFSGVLNLLEYLPWMQVHPLAEFARATLLALLKYPTDPQQLPGIEAQMPESPFIAMLNSLNLTTEADLAVIEGDIEPGDLAERLKYGVVETLFGEDHDLVVNTRAMTGGLKRARGIFKLNHRGQEVSHFSYFTNHRTRLGLVNWLTTTELNPEAATKAGFEIVRAETKRHAPRDGARSVQIEKSAVVFVLPDLLGSHLSAHGQRVWLDQEQLALGGLARLSWGAPQVAPDELLESYDPLLEALRERHEVIPFAYDWRRSLSDAAASLQTEVEMELNRHLRPVRFLAHGAGGLVVRLMIANKPELWKTLRQRDGRLVMLGTPQHGSFAWLQLLAARGRLSALLKLVDLKHRPQDLAAIISQYPGVIELLPEKFLSGQQWPARSNGQAELARPTDQLLDQAKTLRQKLADKAIDREGMLYVAGTGASTPDEMEWDGKGAPTFYSASDGDGQVTLAAGRLDGVRTWYAEAEHGALATRKEFFPALNELLETGATAKLPDAPRVVRGQTSTLRKAVLVAEPQMFPDEQDLLAAALGQDLSPDTRQEVHTLKLSVVHTNLINARFPIAVGHYQEDLIVGAEKVIDRALDRRLSQLMQCGLYPGAEGTIEVIHIKDAEIQGALVIGLGEYGQARRDKVRSGVTMAVLRHALRVLNEGGAPNKEGWRPAAFSALLLGTYSSGQMGVADSVSAIVQGALQANRMLRRQGLWNEVRVDEVEIVELYADVALKAAHAVWHLQEHPPLSLDETEAIVFDPPHLQLRESGLPQRPIDQHAAGWWRRIKIGVDEDAPDRDGELTQRQLKSVLLAERARMEAQLTSAQSDLLKEFIDKAVNAAAPNELQRQLKFTLMTERARLEEKMIPSQRALIEEFITKALKSSDPEQSRKLGMTLFELLIPNAFKNEFGAEGDWLLYVDRESAQYPWELMAQRTRGAAAPLVKERGMIRQLATGEFRANPQAAQGRHVLIVAPKYTGGAFPPLPGAQHEARTVKSLLENRFDVIPLIGETADAPEVIYQLLQNDYRIVHLAGHGHYDAEASEPKARSGMVLSERIWLTAAEIEQLPVVPDLVFINCCFQGAIDREPRANKLAASIALALIQMGVKAVVAAGWAVADDAAQAFAEKFYTSLLADATFGAAVREARSHIASKFADTNTWGAYQCYGSPDFRLDQRTASSARKEARRWFSPGEYRDELQRLAQAARHSKAETLRPQLESLYEDLPTEWLDGEMLAVLGQAWSSLGEADHEQSVRFYQRALSDEKGNLTLHAIQDLANLSGRQARAAHRNAPDDKRAHLVKDYLARELQLLRPLKELSPTAEVSNLFGSHYKRQAEYGPREQMCSNLQLAAEQYKDALELQRKNTGTLDPYPVLNWVLCKTLLDKLAVDPTNNQPASAAQKDDIREVLHETLTEAARLIDHDKIWKRLHYPEALLLQHMLNDTLNEAGKDHREQVKKAYRRAFQQGRINPTELNSVLNQFSFLTEMLRRIKAQLEQARAQTAAPLGKDREEQISESVAKVDEQIAALGEMKDAIQAIAAGPQS